MAAQTRQPLIAGNWKMNLNHLEAIALVQKLAFSLTEEDYATTDVLVVPPFTDLRSVQTLIDADKLKINLGAQTVSEHSHGAYTGDISASMLAKLGCEYALVGHSERRQYHHETDSQVGAQARAALTNGIIPIICVGEQLEQREGGEHLAVVTEQLRVALAPLSAEQIAQVVVAYEPVWAIGTGKIATPANAQEVGAALRAVISEQTNADVAAQTRILYGGSVKAANISILMAQPDIDGALVGGASIDPDEFVTIIRYRLHPPGIEG